MLVLILVLILVGLLFPLAIAYVNGTHAEYDWRATTTWESAPSRELSTLRPPCQTPLVTWLVLTPLLCVI